MNVIIDSSHIFWNSFILISRSLNGEKNAILKKKIARHFIFFRNKNTINLCIKVGQI